MDVDGNAKNMDMKLLTSAHEGSHAASPIERVRWIDYPIATETLLHLQRMMDHPPSHRPPCSLIVGDTNNGKTMIARQFAKRHNAGTSNSATISEYPVVYVQSPPGPSLNMLCSTLLRSVHAPAQTGAPWSRSLYQVTDLFPRLNVKMIIIDEIHNLLQGTNANQEVFLNGLRYLTNELRIPVVAVGVKRVERVFQTDQQLGNRFKTWSISRWDPDQNYALFLNRIIRSSGHTPSDTWKEAQPVQKIHVKCEGLTGETVDLMNKIIRYAKEAGHQVVDPAFIGNVDWVKPDSRRANAR